MIATDRFADLARQSADQVGLAGARIVSVAHPIGGIGPEELDRRADEAVEEIIGRLLDH